MKKLASICFAVVAVASVSLAQMTPGVVATSSDRFPIVADFNGDGLADLFNDRTVSLNNGTSFSSPIDLGIPGRYEAVKAVADVNGDGIPDLLTYDGPLSNTYRLYVADASRHYTTPIVVSTSTQPYFADMDGDGKDEIVNMKPIRDPANGGMIVEMEMTILHWRDNGTLEALPSFRIPPNPQIDHYRIATGDIDRDGITDMVIRCNPDLVVLHGEGNGRFTVQRRWLPMEHMTWGWWNTRLGDVDGDGNLDIITVGYRTLHVLFGNGHGAFPRYASAKVAQLRGATGEGLPFNPNSVDQPRDIAVGHFTRTDHDQIAADTIEGDLVLFDFDNGALSETSRSDTGLTFLDMLPGNFHNAGTTDLVAYSTLDQGEQTPRPQIFYGMAEASAPSTVLRARRRSAAAPPTLGASVVRLTTHVDCMGDSTQEFVFRREGVFGHAANADAVFDGDTIYFRVPVPGVKVPVDGAVTRNSDGSYTGSRSFAECAGTVVPIIFTATVEGR